MPDRYKEQQATPYPPLPELSYIINWALTLSWNYLKSQHRVPPGPEQRGVRKTFPSTFFPHAETNPPCPRSDSWR